MAFNWYKFGLGVLTLFVCAIFFGGTWLAAKQFDLSVFTLIGCSCGAFLIAVALYYVIMVRQGYAIKLGHLAIIEHALRTDSVPENPIHYSKDIIAQRFGSSGKYYLFSRDLDIATRQISRVIARGFTLESDAPNLKTSSKIIRLLSAPSLSYVNECCMAYAIRKKDYEVNAACVDALTILTQNWPKFMATALRTSLIIYAFLLVVSILIFLPGYAFCQAFLLSWIPWVGMSFLFALIFKLAFLDSYILTKMVCNFLNSAAETEIDTKNYAKLDHWSKAYTKFRKNAEKAAEKAEDEADRAERKAKIDAKKALPPATDAQNATDAKPDAEPTKTEGENTPSTSQTSA